LGTMDKSISEQEKKTIDRKVVVAAVYGALQDVGAIINSLSLSRFLCCQQSDTKPKRFYLKFLNFIHDFYAFIGRV